jgi:hypothetical protein
MTGRRLVVGFLAGALAVPIFHQGALALLHAAGVASQQAWAVPQLWSLMFWGGVWGVVLAALLGGLRGGALLGASLLFGALFPTLVAWFVVAPLKGQPMAAGFVPAAMLVGPIVNAAWGLGTGLGLALLGPRERRRSTIDRRRVIQPVEHERRLVARREMALGGFPR